MLAVSNALTWSSPLFILIVGSDLSQEDPYLFANESEELL